MSRTRIIMIVIAVLAVIALTIAIYPGREPFYQGRKLSELLLAATNPDELHESNHHNDPEKWQAAKNAVQQIGTNSVPLLLKMLSSHDSKAKKALILWLDRHPSLHCNIVGEAQRKNAARLGLELLGDKVSAAWPSLIQWTFDRTPQRRVEGLDYLQICRADKTVLLPIMLRLLKDPDKAVQKAVAYRFYYYYPQDAKLAGVLNLFPELQKMQTIQSNTTDMQQILDF
jgi:hypothetical protein